jgi:orotidine-5'-phosphate decarboxylase
MAIALNKFQKNPFLFNPLVVALDVDNEFQALKLAEELTDVAGGFKLGPRLLLRYGPGLISKIAQFAPVFVDHKFFDIPSTMEASIRSVFSAGASLATIHALAGKSALHRMAQVEAELNQIRPFKILAVTILTSWKSFEIESDIFPRSDIKSGVSILGNEVKSSGLTGLVCSGEELDLFDNQDMFLVTPGIRRKKDPIQDQNRRMTPSEAIRSGASAIVVGRPIITAADPRAEALDFSMAMLGSRY